MFSTTPYLGKSVAVVLDGTDLTDEEMQRLARWTNLSETTYVLPPTTAEADYRLRIFTPGGELPFAGHPTLGSARAWLDNGGTPRHADRIVQECAAGLIGVRRGDGILSFAAPPPRRPAAPPPRRPAAPPPRRPAAPPPRRSSAKARSAKSSSARSSPRSASGVTGSSPTSGLTTDPAGP
ncbi:PhzF family phenazine biosynthesis protein [Nonomuraea jabiensis]|uniref:PhzF family phenazine biosynthesis protein n=1 Tax=Nonomuraea jabiensis TaxID=882448 RepID=UPI003D715C12